MKVGSLFSGAGLLDFGLEQAGLETVWQVEYDDWCREVALPQNFPNTEKFKDVREVGKHNLQSVDLICGGFPCQDLSAANIGGKGLDGEKSGLWSEYFRLICELRPRYALIENVAKLAVFGLHRVLSDLASVGYDAEWQTLYATSFGLPSERKRLFIIAYPKSVGPVRNEIFKSVGNQGQHGFKDKFQHRHSATLHLEDIGHSYPQIPEHLRMDNGAAFELSEIERAVKAYGNGVAVPVARWLGERILEFDKQF